MSIYCLSREQRSSIKWVHTFIYLLGLAIRIRNQINSIIYGPESESEIHYSYCGLLFFITIVGNTFKKIPSI